MDGFFKSEDFHQSKADPCLYARTSNDSTVIVLAWVDDLLIVSDNEPIMSKFKLALSEKFKMKDLGQLSWFLGIKFDNEPK